MEKKTQRLFKQLIIIGQGEAMHRKYKSLKLGGGQARDRSAD
jgi:hypothetical protein